MFFILGVSAVETVVSWAERRYDDNNNVMQRRALDIFIDFGQLKNAAEEVLIIYVYSKKHHFPCVDAIFSKMGHFRGFQ